MHPQRGMWIRTFWLTLALLAIFWGNPTLSRAADPQPLHQKLLEGKYAEVAAQAEAALQRYEYSEEWPILAAQAQFEMGKYPEAQRAIAGSLARYPGSVRLRLLGHQVYLHNGQTPRARALLEEINYLAGTRGISMRDPLNRIALGQTALLLGGDPKLILDEFFTRAKKENPKLRESYLAAGTMSLEKNDPELAAKWFEEGLKQHPKDPDLLLGLARSNEESDRPSMARLIGEALDANPNHVPSYLLLVDHLIDGENYEEAGKLLDKIKAINPHHPDAWAYRAVIHHLQARPEEEKMARAEALRFWSRNPRVEYLLGQKLSQKYRFAEGAAHQRTALEFDPSFQPSQVQLAQDLLRLGEESEGWKLADQAHQADGYDVAAYNLVTLHDNLSKFKTLTNSHFVVRMDPKEAGIYGERVLKLLERAHATLTAKYGLKLDKPILVEIFPDQKDFAIRTFGMPGGEGYLGVCFGSVITANSPGSRAAQLTNWEAMLWHEFCHVITLQLTKNKMPRWLSEGISVHEELEADKTWGQEMSPTYRRMILEGELKPIQELSSAFLTPKTPMHLQFAYYESALVVEYIVEKFGREKLVAILKDLGESAEINKTIEKHTTSLEVLEKEFAAFVKNKAEQLAPKLEWEEPAQGIKLSDEWVERHPENLHGLNWLVQKFLSAKKFEEAKAPLKKLIELYPTQVSNGNAYQLLARVHRELKETDLELDVLDKWASMDADAIDAYERLMELQSERKNWEEVLKNAERYLAVNPMLPQPYRFLARAAEESKKEESALSAYRTLLQLNPPDPATVHYRMARIYHTQGNTNALNHVLYALEEAPRFRDAHRLLLEIRQGKSKDSGNEPP